MRSVDDVDSYLLRSGRAYEQVAEGTWRVKSSDDRWSIGVHVEEGLVLFHVQVMELTSRQSALYEQLLRLNATDLVHGAYGIAGDSVVLSSALPLEHLDLNEFLAPLDDFELALNRDIETLRTAK